MHLPIEWLPAQGTPEQLIVLLHGAGADGMSMAPLAQALRSEFPSAALVAPDAPQAYDGGARGHQWFSLTAIDDASRIARVHAVLPALRQWIRATQDRLRVPPVATAIAGFSQGAILGLETALADDGLAGRVLAFSGRFVQPPQAAPLHTTLHLFHGGQDRVIAALHSRAALDWMAAFRGDATLDIAEEVGHEMHPALIQRALFRLRNHIPARTWAQALGAVPGLPSGRHDVSHDD